MGTDVKHVFKVGDKVRLKPYVIANKRYDGITILKNMLFTDVKEIKGVISNNVVIHTDNYDYFYPTEILELASPTSTCKFKKGDIVVDSEGHIGTVIDTKITHNHPIVRVTLKDTESLWYNPWYGEESLILYKPKKNFQIGDIVFHDKHGLGRVMALGANRYAERVNVAYIDIDNVDIQGDFIYIWDNISELSFVYRPKFRIGDKIVYIYKRFKKIKGVITGIYPRKSGGILYKINSKGIVYHLVEESKIELNNGFSFNLISRIKNLFKKQPPIKLSIKIKSKHLTLNFKNN